MSSHFLGSRASVHIAVALEDKCRNNECIPHFLLAFIAEQMSYGMEYPCGQFRSAVLDTSAPKILPTPSLLLRGESWRDSRDAIRALLSSSQNAGGLSTPF